MFGFYFDDEPRNALRHQAVIELFRQIESGVFTAVTSQITVRELNRAPAAYARKLLTLMAGVVIPEPNDEEVQRMTSLYVSDGAVPAD